MKTAHLETRLNRYTEALRQNYGVTDTAHQFSLTEPMEIRLRQKILASDDFLKEISLLDVDQITGQVVDVGCGTLMTGRGDNTRFQASSGLEGLTFNLVDTDSCCAIPWAKLAVWGNAGTDGQFQKMVSGNAIRNFSLDMLKIGFNGIKVARPTDPKANPLGQDVNVGWHQYVKNNAPQKIITDPIYLDVDGHGDYKNLDSLVQGLINSHIDPVFIDDPSLVVVVGRDLVAYEQHRLLNAANTPTEHQAAQALSKTIAGRKAYLAPYFPGKRLWITPLKNLQILTQRGSRRRKAKDNDDKMQFESSYWRFEGFAIGNPDAFAGIDETAIVLGPRPGAKATLMAEPTELASQSSTTPAKAADKATVSETKTDGLTTTAAAKLVSE